MSCPSRNPGHPLTASQKEELLRLYAVRALDRGSGQGPFGEGMRGLNPNVQGALRDKGLADSRTIRRAGASQFTAYWLTAAGLERVAQITGTAV